MSHLTERIQAAAQAGHLLDSSLLNIEQILSRSRSPLVRESVEELVAAEAWAELNDRFFKTLAFGTGGLRGRTIGKVITKAEAGTPQPLGRPEHPCVGTNAMNDFNISRATQGLAAYLKGWFATEGRAGRPKIAIAYDSRHFSRHFAELTAQVAIENGVDVILFSQPRSTPELSFAVRATRADAGIVITASHNPPHDNGFKVYFNDGAQVIEPHASGIIAKVNAVESDAYTPLPEAERGSVREVDEEIDTPYLARLETLILDPEVLQAGADLRIVFTSIHGTGGEITRPALERLGFRFTTVAAQDGFDGRFPTVKSPNPENAEALALAIAQAEAEGADLVFATDPDCDRMGVACKDKTGRFILLSGNQIGSLMAWYRTTTLLRQGVLHAGNLANAVIIKTFVTTDLQKAIAQKARVRCVETLTGFKYIGAKLTKYERALPAAIRENYRERSEAETRAARLADSSFYIFGGEESYGYSGADFVRDKDGNGAVVMFAEVAAYAKANGLTLDALLDKIYAEYGYYREVSQSLTFEGAEGAAKIRTLVDSYAVAPARELDGCAVVKTINHATDTVTDVEGEVIPPEAMLIMELADGRRVAVRPSGTEPKIKFYLFGHRAPQGGFSETQLAQAKAEVSAGLDSLWSALRADVDRRLGA